MHRRTVLTGLTATFLAARPALAAPIPINRISNYFNRLTTLEAPFTQYNADGSRSTGTLYIRRPGRARFEYDPPEDALVMAGGGQLAIFDGKSNKRRPEQYPLGRTPLNVILERRVDLGASGVVIGHSGTPQKTTVIARDPENPDQGRIALIFADNPMRLVEWVTEDTSGAVTRVVLGPLKTGHDLSSRLFNIPLEIQSRN